MDNKLMVFGHKNPDTDSITSAIALAHLRSILGNTAEAYRLGEVNSETEFVLNYFNLEKPAFLENVKIQIKDLKYDTVKPLTLGQSIYHAYNYMNDADLTTLPVVGKDNYFLGLITMTDIAMSMIHGDHKLLDTTYDNALAALLATQLVRVANNIKGEIVVAALQAATIMMSNVLDSNSILIVGDRLDIVHFAITKKVKLIIITGGRTLPKEYIDFAVEQNVNIMSTIHHTFETTRIITLTNMIGSILNENQLHPFRENDYLDDCIDQIETSKHSKFAIVDENNIYKGIIGRAHIIHPGKKDVILVDHNEYGQSAVGLEQANILEVIDHHKIGDISTSTPIVFRNLPYGSTNTIVFYLYKEHGKEIPDDIAGIMLSGVISDTLLFKSPTTTVYDKLASEELTKQLDIDLNVYAARMFEAGTSIAGKEPKDVILSDFKEFTIEQQKIGLGQVLTLNLETILNVKDIYIETLNQLADGTEYDVVILVITHITDEGSSFLYSNLAERLIKVAFEQEPKQGMFIEGIVSRKKQIVPKLINAIKLIDKGE